jgi:regulator of sigma E protease
MELLSGFYNVLLILLGFGLLIFVHELGHFAAAKWANIRTEAFAVGMGPVIVAWRRGVGFAAGSTHHRVVARTGKPAHELSDVELVRHGIGETEYSLRWIPIGGFVKMLGQDDLRPGERSEERRSYNVAPIGKRMIVVSAGVIMNLVLAAALFVVVFMVGVRFEAPVVGGVAASAPAGTTLPDNAAALRITEPGLKPGDRVVAIDGKRTETFNELFIAAAMSRPDVPITLTVERAGYDRPLVFSMHAEHSPMLGMRSIGVDAAASAQLRGPGRKGDMQRALEALGLAQHGVAPGMALIEANGRHVDTFQQLQQHASESGGAPIVTRWAHLDRDGRATSEPVEVVLTPQPDFATMGYVDTGEKTIQNFELGLFGMLPLVRIEQVVEDSPNVGILHEGDAVVWLGELHAPRLRQFREYIRDHPAGPLKMTVVRDGEEMNVTATVRRRSVADRAGMLNVLPGYAWDSPYMAGPMAQVLARANGEREPRFTPIAKHDLPTGALLHSVGDRPVSNWIELREALREETRDAFAGRYATEVPLAVSLPLEQAIVSMNLELGAEDVQLLHSLGWTIHLPPMIFEPLFTVRTAGGNPFRAVVMGVEETHKMLVMTYLTIDRLFRRTVGVDQLRGPVGIIHLGTQIAERGMLYLLFLLAVISVNLAVINFLPLPILDGGLFLFLIYEKLKGRPPSVAFQNALTVIGLAMIVALVIVVTYHDIMRLFS